MMTELQFIEKLETELRLTVAADLSLDSRKRIILESIRLLRDAYQANVPAVDPDPETDEFCSRCGHAKSEHSVIDGCHYLWPDLRRCLCQGFER